MVSLIMVILMGNFEKRATREFSATLSLRRIWSSLGSKMGPKLGASPELIKFLSYVIQGE
jgi:hypothetical protein